MRFGDKELNNILSTLYFGMVDVEPLPISPTWINGHLSENGIAKRLDRFLVNNSLLEKMDKYRSWVDSNRF